MNVNDNSEHIRQKNFNSNDVMTEQNTHQPVVPDKEYDSNWQALKRFVGPALQYSLRHLTVGTTIRCRRAWLKWRERKYVI